QADPLTDFERIRLCVRLVFRWGRTSAFLRFLFRRNVVLMVPLRIARKAFPGDENLIAQYSSDDPVRGCAIAQANSFTDFEWVRFYVRLVLRDIVTLNVVGVCSVDHFSVPAAPNSIHWAARRRNAHPHR